MRQRLLLCTLTLFVGLGTGLPEPADAQVLKRLRRAATNAAQQEVENKIARLVGSAVRCLLDDLLCYEKAKAAGEDVIFVDDEGDLITDDEGVPVTDPDEAKKAAPPPAKPGEGVWSNYDFVPGDEILFYDDFTADAVGGFPSRLTLEGGNWEIVDWQGQRLLRNTGPRTAAILVPLPRDLPARFTIELDVHFTEPNQRLAITTYSPEPAGAAIEGHYFQAGVRQGSGLQAGRSVRVESVIATEDAVEKVVPFRAMVNDRYARVYVGSQRVANVPNAEVRRGNVLRIENSYSADVEHPIYIGGIRVAGHDLDLYDRIAADGRAVTRGVLFASNSDRIRPESTPTLMGMVEMLGAHEGLRLRIEGHTDATGEAAYNRDLSERRAQAVKSWLVEQGIAEDRLEAAGLGAADPMADNGTPEGRQKNRRVELVRID